MRIVGGALAAGLVALLLTGPAAMAQDASTPSASTIDDLVVLDAHIEGSGPWTSWFGGAPDRTLVLVLGNQGSTPLELPLLTLAFGRGPEPNDPVAAPAIEPILPGDSTTVRVDLDLPTFAIGTYAVEGTFFDETRPRPFRAETSHIPWVLVLLPAAVLLQLVLVRVRNRVRDRIHARPTREVTTDPTVIDLGGVAPLEPAAGDGPTLEHIVCEELDTVFEDAFARNERSLSDRELTALVVELAEAAAVRVADRAELDERSRHRVLATMTDALLDTFGLPASSRV